MFRATATLSLILFISAPAAADPVTDYCKSESQLPPQQKNLNDKLIAAAFMGQLSDLKNSLSSGANPNAYHCEEGLELPAIWIALLHNMEVFSDRAVFDELFNANADLRAPTIVDGVETEAWTGAFPEPNGEQRASETYSTLLTKLKDAHVNVDVANSKGHFPLWEVCADAYWLGSGKRTYPDELVGQLIDLGADPNRLYHIVDVEAPMPQSQTPLILTTVGNRPDRTRQLLERGANVDGMNDDGNTALMFAATWNQAETVEVLVQHGANVNLRNTRYESAASLAQQNNHPNIVQYLCDHGATDYFCRRN